MAIKTPNGSETGPIAKPETVSGATGPEMTPGRLDWPFPGVFPPLETGTFWFDGKHYWVDSTPERPVFGMKGRRYVVECDGVKRVLYVWRNYGQTTE
jgi:hypothetical protein